MARKRYEAEIKKQVLKLGAQGKTYREIREKFPIPKSTLSVWFNRVNKGRGKDKAYMMAHLARARKAARETILRNKEARLAEAERQAELSVKKIPLRNRNVLKGLLAMLYWAEGSKGDRAMTIFTNTDPLLVLYYLSVLRKVYSIDESKIRIRLHLHYYHSAQTTLTYWSKLLNVPKSQFGKIHVKKRSTRKRFRKNFQGICFIVYHDIRIRRELLALGRSLAKQPMLS